MAGQNKYSLVRARVPKRARGKGGKGVSITVEGGAPLPAPVGDHDKLANVKTLTSFKDSDKAVHLTPKQAKKLLRMMQDVNTAIGAGVSAANDFTNVTASTLTLTGSQQFIASHNSQIAQLNKQEDALKDHALLSAELKALMLGFRGKVNAAMTALKALLRDKKWDDVAVQEKVTELKTMLGHYAESIALSQKSLTDRVNQGAIAGLQDILNQANQHANQLSASTLAQANQHTNEAIAPLNQSLIEQAARMDEMQKQIDKEVSHYNGEYIPTDANYPANEWTTPEAKKRHINDTFTDLRPKEDGTEAGYSWKWLEASPNVFKWVVVADGGEAALLAEIAALHGAVDGKVSHYSSKPTSYGKDDFWTLEQDYVVSGNVWRKGSVVSAIMDSEVFNWAHWRNPRYISLDDITVGGVNLLKKSKRVVVPRKFAELKPSETIKAGTTVTVSVGKITSNFDGQLRVIFRKPDGYHESFFFDKSDKPQSQTIVLTDPVTGVLFYSSDGYQDTQDYTTTWEDIKIEAGNVATAWSPAPEDVEEKVNLNILSSSVVTKNSAKASSLLDNITKKRKEIEARYLKISPICPRSLASQFLNVFTNYKGAEEALRNACNSFISGSNQTDEQYLNLIGEAATNGKPHKKYIEALDSYTRIEAEADRGKDGYSAQINLVKESVPVSVVGNNNTPYMIAKWDLDKTLVGTAGVDKYYTCVIKYKFTKKTPTCRIYPYMAGQFAMGPLAEGENVSVYYPNLRYGISIDSIRLYANSASGNGGDFGSVDVDWVCLYEGKIDNPPLTFMPSESNLKPSLTWIGTSLQINSDAPVNLQGPQGETGTFSPEQLAMLEGDHASIGNLQGSVNAHNITLGQHTTQINQHSGKIDNLQGSVNAHNASINNLQGSVNAHNASINNLQGSVNAHGNTLSAHGQSISSHTTQISQHTNQIGQHGGTLSAHGQQLTAHGMYLEEHGEAIQDLVNNFGIDTPSILVSTQQQYLQVLGEIERQAVGKGPGVCSTIRLISSELPIILPCPEKFVDRQITIARLAEPLNYCAQFHDSIYIHTTKSPNTVGILAGGSMPFNNFVYDSQAPGFSGCRGYRINQNVTGLNKFRALSEIDCNQSLSITFQAVSFSSGYRWILLDVSAFDARISPYEADTIWGATRQVRGQAPWTIQYNGLVVPTSKQSSSTFTVTDKMGWIEYNGSSRTATMDFPSSLPEGFMCYVQNNFQQTIGVTGCTPLTTLNRIPARSLCMCRKGTRSNMLIFQISTI
jgi:predicted  nucleic acid-binding Zn-ribbon protein